MNNRLQIPRFPQATNFTISRGSILDGTFVTYFAPGQGPTSTNLYYPPTDWIRAGAILRMPQQVWLNLSIDSQTIVDASAPFGLALNPYLAGYLSLFDICTEVKSRIEALRPNKTWVEILSQSFSYKDPTVPDGGDIPLPNNHSDDPHFLVGNGAWLSNVAPGDFLGTHFMQISMGGFFETGPGQTPLSGPDFDDLLALYAPVGLLSGSYPDFASYRHMIYGPAGFLLPPGVDIVTQRWIDDNMREFLQIVADQLADFGTTYNGTYDTLTADGLVDMIADNFGFDPVSGRDL